MEQQPKNIEQIQPKDPNFWDRIIPSMLKQLKEIEKKNNTIPISEFNHKYRPLFVKKELALLSEDKKEEMAKEYATRISAYSPVEIVTDGPDPQIIMTLPPMFSRISSLNELGSQVPMVMDHFNNAMKSGNKNPLSLEPEKVKGVMDVVVQKAGNMKAQESFNQYAKCMDKLTGADKKQEEQTKPKVDTDSFEWEDDH